MVSDSKIQIQDGKRKRSLRDCSVCGKQPNVAVTCSEDKDSSPRSNPKSKNQALVIHRPGHGQ